ncbi:MAG: haloacid dehalogenase-like hydrolase, partial [Clostridium sp.]|nr:haloacid dehalogenase-like hydrolase [Clostridium sp.]
SADELDRFARRIAAGASPAVLSLIDNLRAEGCKLLLTSASPESYVRLIGRLCGFDYSRGTPLSPSPETYVENRGEAKVRSLRELLEATGGVLRAVVTDHSDDIPLMGCNSGTNYLVGPRARTIRAVREAGIDFATIRR